MLATWQSITVEQREKYEIRTEVFISFVTVLPLKVQQGTSFELRRCWQH